MADSLRQAGLDLSSMVRSKHSIDVLAKGISKARLIAHIIQNFKIDPQAILTMGDQGAWPGNDTALLEHRYSLSVDVPSRRLDRGWKLAPAHCGTWTRRFGISVRSQLNPVPTGFTFQYPINDIRPIHAQDQNAAQPGYGHGVAR